MERRDFLSFAGLAATAGLVTPAPAAAESRQAAERPTKQPTFRGVVDFSVDGLGLSPREYAADLSALAETSQIEIDSYSLGGTVTALEQQFASLLGKERAVFVPTGTLANHMAVRRLAGNDRRVLVQAESHLYNDCGDCADILSGLVLIPLAPGCATFTLDDVKTWVARTAGGRIASRIGVIVIESPVRRRYHEMFDFATMQAVCAYAREQGIRLHLDGARLFNIPFHTRQTVQQITALFDTVYVSLWKCFNAASGAILAGRAQDIDGLFHMRRLFGGSLPQAWPGFAVARKYVDGYPKDYASAWDRASRLLAKLQQDARFSIERIPNGTSAFKLRLNGVDAGTFAARLESCGVVLPHPEGTPPVFRMIVNTSLNRAEPEALAGVLIDAARP